MHALSGCYGVPISPINSFLRLRLHHSCNFIVSPNRLIDCIIYIYSISTNISSNQPLRPSDYPQLSSEQPLARSQIVSPLPHFHSEFENSHNRPSWVKKESQLSDQVTGQLYSPFVQMANADRVGDQQLPGSQVKMLKNTRTFSKKKSRFGYLKKRYVIFRCID